MLRPFRNESTASLTGVVRQLIEACVEQYESEHDAQNEGGEVRQLWKGVYHNDIVSRNGTTEGISHTA